MKSKTKKYSLIGAGVALVLGVALCTLPVKRKIDKTVNAVQWQFNDEENAKNLKVKIKGSYKDYLFRNDTFKGEIQIEGYEDTYNAEPLNITFNNGEGDLVYRHYDNEAENVEDIIQMNTLGSLVCSPDFNEFLILAFSPGNAENKSWDQETGMMISGDAENLSDAKEIAAKMFEQDQWFKGEENPFKK